MYLYATLPTPHLHSTSTPCVSKYRFCRRIVPSTLFPPPPGIPIYYACWRYKYMLCTKGFTRGVDHDLDLLYHVQIDLILPLVCMICVWQVQPRKHVLDRAHYTAHIWQPELGHTDHTYHTDHTDTSALEYLDDSTGIDGLFRGVNFVVFSPNIKSRWS